MKRLVTKNIFVMLSAFLILLVGSPALIATSGNQLLNNELLDLEVVSSEVFEEIKILEEELMKLNNKKIALENEEIYLTKNYSTALNKNELIDIKSTQISQIDMEIEAINAQLFELGAERPSKEFLLELLINSPDMVKNNSLVSTTSIYDDMEEIIDTWEGMYNIIGVPYNYSGKTQYHLTFMYKGNDPYLSKNQTKVIYNQFTANSTIAAHWVSEVLSLYTEKAIGAALKQFDILPWELLFSSKPSNAISSSGDATVATLHTLTTIKFVFVYNTSSQSWFFALSNSYTNIDYEVSAYVIRNNQIYQSEVGDNITVYGDYNSSQLYANQAYDNGVPVKRTLSRVRLTSKSMNNDQIMINFHSPNFVGQMY